jgi:hypothetical protein
VLNKISSIPLSATPDLYTFQKKVAFFFPAAAPILPLLVVASTSGRAPLVQEDGPATVAKYKVAFLDAQARQR